MHENQLSSIAGVLAPSKLLDRRPEIGAPDITPGGETYREVWTCKFASSTSWHLCHLAATSIGCTTGNQVVDILVKLKADLAIKLDLLDGCYNSGTDPADIIAEIVVLVNVAVALILDCPKDLLGLLNGQLTVIVNLCVSIIVDIATHCGKWSDKPNFDAFLSLCVVIDVALKGLLSACSGLLGVILGLLAGLLGGANLALLAKVKFNLCIAFLGL
ncbi:hypothetical protein FRC12_004914 [Ceratobasidium sp. 428]|nr:hypothetical protein FRC12_004914 [Ceratobasidium sp. 428]